MLLSNEVWWYQYQKGGVFLEVFLVHLWHVSPFQFIHHLSFKKGLNLFQLYAVLLLFFYYLLFYSYCVLNTFYYIKSNELTRGRDSNA